MALEHRHNHLQGAQSPAELAEQNVKYVSDKADVDDIDTNCSTTICSPLELRLPSSPDALRQHSCITLL